MLALLGLLAVAGFQNRDKIGAALQNLGGGGAPAPGGLGNVPGGTPQAADAGLGGLLSGLAGGNLSGGLGDILNSFKDAGHGAVADSWVTPGVPTQGLNPQQVADALGDANLSELTQKTGLSRDELLKRLSTELPAAVDTLTPNGQMPNEQQLRQRLGLTS
jgi:uncharacterized protein YidB (DUF937 family)